MPGGFSEVECYHGQDAFLALARSYKYITDFGGIVKDGAQNRNDADIVKELSQKHLL